MRGPAPKLLALALACAALLALAAPALAAPHFEGSFKVSGTGANNVKMVQGSDGNVWMTLEGMGSKDVARITPAGVVTEFEFEGVVKKPIGIVSGPEGALWVTTEEGVATFSTAEPTKATETAIPAIKGNSSIVAGPNGEMWVAATAVAVHFKPSSPATALAIPIVGLMPHDIDAAGQLLVIADSNNGRIVTVTTTGQVGEVPFVGNPGETSQGVAGSPSGQFAFSESDGKEGLALATPPAPASAEKRMGDPFGVAQGSDGAFYFAMSADETVRRLPPSGPSTAIEGLPKGFHPRQISAGANNTIWVAMENNVTNTVEVARISGLEPPPTVVQPSPPPSPRPAPQTSIGKKPKKVVKTTAKRAGVSFGFSSSVAGSSFECSLAHKVAPKGKGKAKGKGRKPKPHWVGGDRFRVCSSPRSYMLKPGRYRFAVAAVATGQQDLTPATYGFEVERVAEPAPRRHHG